jgi:tetratricopeptide (TPR) repeat protein
VGLELRLVEAPRHIFCRAKVDDKHWINWDTNEGESYSDQDYARSCGVQPQQIADGIYLSSFVDDRTMSMAYVGRGLRLAREGRFSEAADDLRHALDLDPKSPIAASSLSFVYSASPLGVGAGEAQKNETLLLANRAVALDPNLGCVQESLAAALAESGDFPGAVSAAGRAVELARPDERHGAMQLQQEFLAGRTILQGMRHHAPVFFWLMYERGWVVCVAVVVLLFVLKALFRPSASDAQPALPPQFAPPAPAPLEGRLVYPEEMAASAGNVLPLPPPLPPQ